MKSLLLTTFVTLGCAAAIYVRAQSTPQYTAATLPTSDLLSAPGPSFRVADSELPEQPVFIAYGDQRFTDPANTKATDPRVKASSIVANDPED